MERIRADDPQASTKAAKVVASGGVIIYPTDTLYGLGADALSDEAVAKIYAVKGRQEGKPIHAIVADMEMAEQYAALNETARKIAERFFPGPLTLILKKNDSLVSGITNGIDTFGFRIPDSTFCIALARAFDGPVTATSANKSHMRPERSVDAILAQLADTAHLIDLVVDAGELPDHLPSTVVDISSNEAIILREGAIPSSDILAAAL